MNPSFKTELSFKPMENFGGGFRAEWVSTKGDGTYEAGVDSGAGLGNAFLTFWIEENGVRHYFTADISDVLVQAIEHTRGKCQPKLKSRKSPTRR